MTNLLTAALGVAVIVGSWALLIYLVLQFGWMGVLYYLGISIVVGAIGGVVASVAAAV
jgi:hypothetical protein